MTLQQSKEARKIVGDLRDTNVLFGLKSSVYRI